MIFHLILYNMQVQYTCNLLRLLFIHFFRERRGRHFLYLKIVNSQIRYKQQTVRLFEDNSNDEKSSALTRKRYLPYKTCRTKVKFEHEFFLLTNLKYLFLISILDSADQLMLHILLQSHLNCLQQVIVTIPWQWNQGFKFLHYLFSHNTQFWNVICFLKILS